MENQREYWNGRAKTFSHTGWGSYQKYAFDQPARLKAIRSVLDWCLKSRRTALDYGCGNGDFSSLLASSFEKVKAFDISDEVIEIARKKNREYRNIEFGSDSSFLENSLPDGSVDLVLSVTVLGHILDNRDLREVLKVFQRKLSADGRLVALEYSLPGKLQSSDYQRFSTSEEWEAIFNESGLSIESKYGFYHPDKRPTLSYLLYKFDPRKIFWSMFKSSPNARERIGQIAEKRVKGTMDFLWEGKPDDWMRIMILRKT